jgi:SAM-dependent methyltransferase
MHKYRNNPDVDQLHVAFRPGPSSALYLVRTILLDAILRHRFKLSGTMMDFGCGQSPYRSLFAHTHYIGIDIHTSGFPQENKKAEYFFDGETIPFADGYFDSILCTEVMEHLFHPEVALCEFQRVLKPGGRMLMTCPFMWELHEEPWDYARYTSYAITQMMQAAGFEVEVMEKAGHSIQALAQQRILYFTSQILPRLPSVANRAAWHLGVTACNLLADFFSKRLPNSETIYLSNVIVARKI